MDPETIVRRAISSKVPIQVCYRNTMPRLLCPHAFGMKGIKVHLFSYQIGGYSSSKLGPTGSGDNWRCMNYDLITGCPA